MIGDANHMTLLIVGAGGLGREVAATALALGNWNEIAFVDDNATEPVNGLSIWGDVADLSTAEGHYEVMIAIGNPSLKRSIHERLKKNEKLTFPTIVHPNARIHWPEYVHLGNGTYIADGTIITTNVRIGDFVLINLGCTVGHDTTIGDYSCIMPSANISGGATIEEEVYIGTGAKLIKATNLGRGCVVGAGAVVNVDIPINETWGGVPAKPLK